MAPSPSHHNLIVQKAFLKDLRESEWAHGILGNTGLLINQVNLKSNQILTMPRIFQMGWRQFLEGKLTLRKKYFQNMALSIQKVNW